jgi:hypothetical protein
MMQWAVASDVTPALLDLDDGRLAAMDDAGIDGAVPSPRRVHRLSTVPSMLGLA